MRDRCAGGDVHWLDRIALANGDQGLVVRVSGPRRLEPRPQEAGGETLAPPVGRNTECEEIASGRIVGVRVSRP